MEDIMIFMTVLMILLRRPLLADAVTGVFSMWITEYLPGGHDGAAVNDDGSDSYDYHDDCSDNCDDDIDH